MGAEGGIPEDPTEVVDSGTGDELEEQRQGEERALEMLMGISGGDYSPNSHTFFKNPNKNSALANLAHDAGLHAQATFPRPSVSPSNVFTNNSKSCNHRNR
jgi:hypothetical protein